MEDEVIIFSSTGECVNYHKLRDFHRQEFMDELAERQDNIRKGNQVRKSKEKFHMYMNEKFGSFYFNKYNKTIDKFVVNGKYESGMAFRFLYLCTFMDFNCKLRYGGKFRNIERDFMQEKDLHEVLNLSKRETINTKQFLFNLGLLKKDEEGNLIINCMYSKKGSITESYNRESTRFFDHTIKCMYCDAKPTEHKLLGIYLKLLPLVNYKHNVICKNPDEEDIARVIPMTQKEIFEYLGLAKNTYINLLEIKVNNNYVYAKISTGAYRGFFVVNPSVYYAGNDLTNLKGIEGLFNIGKAA